MSKFKATTKISVADSDSFVQQQFQSVFVSELNMFQLSLKDFLAH